jgi:HD-like signal output (HDOD) protein
MLAGEIQTLPLPDLLRWLAHRRQNGRLVLLNSQGQQAELYFAQGQLTAAQLIGEPHQGGQEELRAIFDLTLAWRLGRFSYEDGPLPPAFAQTGVRLAPEQLLAEFTPPRAASATPDDEYSEIYTQSDALRMQIVDRLLRDAFNVPVMPQLAARIWELTSTDDFSLRDLSRYVLADQGVAARVLRYANSVINNRGQEIDSLNLAVQRLGANQVVNIVLAASLQSRQSGSDLFAAQKKQMWRKSVVKAFIAHPLAVCVGLNSGLGFLCGLLMDFGTNVLYALIQDVLREQNDRRPLPLPTIEKIIRDYHPRVGRVVGEKWDLPQVVIEAMAYHHSLSVEESQMPYTAIAAFADFLGEATLKVPRAQLEAALISYEPELLLCLPVARQLNLTRVQVSALLTTLPHHFDQALAFMAD